MKRSLGTHYTQMRYFHLDRTFKSFKLLGAADLPEESNDPNSLGWNDKPKSEDHGGWQWHVLSVIDIEFKLNGDNTVCRMCNFKAPEVLRTADPTTNMTFFLSQPRAGMSDKEGGSHICPGFDPPPKDRTLARHKELDNFFKEENVFRAQNAPGPVEVRALYLSAPFLCNGSTLCT